MYKHLGLILLLYEIVECFYRHPQALESALISRIEINKIKTYHTNDVNSSSAHLLKWALDNITNQCKSVVSFDHAGKNPRFVTKVNHD
jgi:hypothetical protein